MRMAFIDKKLCNIDQIKWIDTVQREDGRIDCLFVFEKNLSLYETYDNADEMQIKFEEYGLFRKETRIEECITAITEFLRHLAIKYKRRRLKIVK